MGNKYNGIFLTPNDQDKFEELKDFALELAQQTTNGYDFFAFFVQEQKLNEYNRKMFDAVNDANICADAVNLYTQLNQILKDFCDERNIK